MLNFEISLSNNQEVCPVNSREVEHNAGLILEYIFKSENILNLSVLRDFDLSDKTISVDILLTDDEEIRELNSSYRGLDRPTDVMSFALFADGTWKEVLPNGEIALGEVIISVETAKKQADDGGMEFEEQLDFLLCHGILHLMGYEHPDEESLEVILKIQDEILAGINFQNL